MIVKKFKEWFDDLSPKAKKSLIYAVAGAVVLLFSLNIYKSRQESTIQSAPEKIKAVELDKDLLRKTELAENRRKVESMGTAIEKLQNEQKSLIDRYKNENNAASANKTLPLKPGTPGSAAPGSNAAQAGPGAVTPGADTTLPKIPDSSEVEARGGHFPPPPGQTTEQTGQQLPVPLAPGATPGGSARVQQHQEKKTLGEITVISNPTKTEPQKKNERTVYLPPSFMSAILLTGLDAGTSNSGQSNPDPILLRVQTPAVLPNDVKANLSGCFVVAEGQGRLDKERVDVRLVSLSCLTREGSAVIDTPIKGFVTDADAKTGLAGHVVSRMGASVARTLIAGMFQGAGEMLKTESTSTMTSGLGTVQSIDPSKVGSYALGNGMSTGSQRLADFYLTLAKQATPVIEANADKHVTVVVSEGKELVIKDLKQQDDGLANNED